MDKNKKLSVVSDNNTEPEAWYVLRGKNKYGPYTYFELIRLLQQKTLFEYDFVWNVKMDNWKAIAEAPEFNSEKIRGLQKETNPEVREVFFRRRYSRIRMGSSILIHDNNKVWRGESLEVGLGGAGIVLPTDKLEIGQIIYLHFKAGDLVPPFNANCEIANKCTVQGGGVRYGLKFVNISRAVLTEIEKLTENKKSAA